MLTLGVELPLDNDWSPDAVPGGRLPGEPDLAAHHDRAVLADRLGFAALWLRDVPLYDPSFGDAGQVFDPFPYLGYLAAVTSRIVLGTAAIALPLRHPLQVAKMAATVERLSGGRLVLGVASGDRPVEFPAFGVDHAARAELVRTGVAALRSAWAPGTTAVLPKPSGHLPLVMAGRGGQTVAWIAEHLDGHFTYHRPPAAMAEVADYWHHATPVFKPLLTTMLVDLAEDPNTPTHPMRFGARLGAKELVEYLDRLRAVGVNHVALNFRPSRRPVEEVMEEIARDVLPGFTP